MKGLDAFPPEDHPHPIVHGAFLGMVALGLAAAAFAAVTLVWWIRRRSLPEHRRWLQAALVLGPSGMVATELGWIVTEVGRQPWTVYDVLRTRDLVTPVGGLWLPFVDLRARLPAAGGGGGGDAVEAGAPHHRRPGGEGDGRR